MDLWLLFCSAAVAPRSASHFHGDTEFPWASLQLWVPPPISGALFCPQTLFPKPAGSQENGKEPGPVLKPRGSTNTPQNHPTASLVVDTRWGGSWKLLISLKKTPIHPLVHLWKKLLVALVMVELENIESCPNKWCKWLFYLWQRKGGRFY